MRIRITSISCRQSAKLPSNRSTEIYLISKTPFVLVLFVGEEGTDPRPSPTKDGDCEGDLSFIPWMDELGIVDGPKRGVELNQLIFAEQLLLLFLIHNQAIFGQGIPGPLMKFCLATGTSYSDSEFTYIVYCTSVFLIDKAASNSSKSSKEPLRKSIY